MQGDQDSDASIAGGLMQAYLDEVLATYTLSRPWQRIGVSAPPRPPREVVLPLREMLVNPLDEKGRPLRLDMDAEMLPTGLISAAIEQLPHTVTCCSLLDERVQTKGSMFLGSWRPLWACLAQGSLRLYENRASLADAKESSTKEPRCSHTGTLGCAAARPSSESAGDLSTSVVGLTTVVLPSLSVSAALSTTPSEELGG